tara:strand:+ start:20657 stop:20959 length:303 start_codon:yes stop_codon:yes gene_type:complete
MPRAARITDSVATGHACDATTTIAGALQSSVIINGLVGAVNGDALAAHTILSGNVCVPHSATVNEGSGTVFYEGIAAARLGDSADAGSITGASSDVYAGG